VLTKDRTSRQGFQAADRRSELTLENANHVGTGSQLKAGVGGRGSEDGRPADGAPRGSPAPPWMTCG